MKISKIGWVGKTQDFPIITVDENEGCFRVENIFLRGQNRHWMSNDWPPRKVIVTVEDTK